mmetsp:Transcript_666/g.1976  ORF Transcript_666/g.1976 Transcript_666/m.1976 type:complete len:294 (+) Transcript_666:1223-2104(+)|eukprot:scaffold3161_cov118-Isochrysis_galbana.AAC.5
MLPVALFFATGIVLPTPLPVLPSASASSWLTQPPVTASSTFVFVPAGVAIGARNEGYGNSVPASVGSGARNNGYGVIALTAAASLALFSSEPAMAAAPAVANAVPSALAAYGHYLALLGMVAALVTERLLIKNDMSENDFDLVTTADSVSGIAGLLLTVTGYLRVTQYGKGWEFYQHEPVFWLKLVLLSVLGAASFFPTTKIIQLSVAKRDPAVPYTPMSPKLVKRMTTIINAELLALASIPLTATLMARGVGYVEWFPWQAGAALVALTIGGLGYKYVKEALDWSEEATEGA